MATQPLPKNAIGYIQKAENTVNVNITSESDRIDKFQWRRNMLEDNFYSQVEKELGNVVTSSTETGLIKQIDDTNNIFTMVIEEISKVYHKPPKRIFSEDNDELQEQMEQLYKDIKANKVLKQSNIYMNAFNDGLIQVGYSNKKDNFTLKLRTPENLIVKVNDDLELEEVYVYVNTDSETKKQTWYGYTNEKIFMLQDVDINNILTHKEEDEKIIDGMPGTTNPLGFLPFVPYHNGFRDLTFWQMYKGDALVKGNIQISIKLTFLNQLIKFQSFKQLVATSTNGTAKSLEGVTIDPASVIYLFGEDSKIDTLDLESNYKQLWETLKEINTNLATNYKISPNMFRMTQAPSSGFALMMENIKLDGFVKSQQEEYIEIEEELFAMLKAIDEKLGKNKISADSITVNFHSINYPKSDVEVLEVQEKEIELGKTSPVEIIEEERGVDEDTAEEIYTKNIQDRNKMNEQFNSNVPTANVPVVDEGN